MVRMWCSDVHEFNIGIFKHILVRSVGFHKSVFIRKHLGPVTVSCSDCIARHIFKRLQCCCHYAGYGSGSEYRYVHVVFFLTLRPVLRSPVAMSLTVLFLTPRESISLTNCENLLY